MLLHMCFSVYSRACRIWVRTSRVTSEALTMLTLLHAALRCSTCRRRSRPRSSLRRSSTSSPSSSSRSSRSSSSRRPSSNSSSRSSPPQRGLHQLRMEPRCAAGTALLPGDIRTGNMMTAQQLWEGEHGRRVHQHQLAAALRLNADRGTILPCSCCHRWAAHTTPRRRRARRHL